MVGGRLWGSRCSWAISTRRLSRCCRWRRQPHPDRRTHDRDAVQYSAQRSGIWIERYLPHGRGAPFSSRRAAATGGRRGGRRAPEAELKKRTLTNLYNARPVWLQQAHVALDRAVWAAYGWDDPNPTTVEEDVLLARLLALNLERAHASAASGEVRT